MLPPLTPGTALAAGSSPAALDLQTRFVDGPPSELLRTALLAGWEGLTALAVLLAVALWVGYQVLVVRRSRWARVATEGTADELLQAVRRPEVLRALGRAAPAAATLATALEDERRNTRNLTDELAGWRERFDQCPLPAFVVGAVRRIASVNEEACRLFARSAEELRGRELPDLLAEESRHVPGWVADAVTVGERVRSQVVRVQRPSGEALPVLLVSRPVVDDQGEARAELCTLVDLRGFPIAAPSRREEKTEPALEAMGRLAASVANDLNDVLTTILGHGSLLSQSLPAGHAAHLDAAAIECAADQAQLLTRQLLAFSRRQAVQTRTVDVAETVREAEHLVRRELGDVVALEVDTGAEPVCARCAPEQLSELLRQLARNAREAMPGGGVFRIEARTVHDVPSHALGAPGSSPGADDGWVRLRFGDTGPGMDERTLAAALEPGFSTKERHFGMGLSSVFGIVTQNRGRLALTARPEGGTSVDVYLPQVPPAVQPARRDDARPAVDECSGTVCVVEDDDQVRSLLVSVLERGGYRVLPAGSGTEALGLCADGDVDVVLSDVNMPGMSGPELCDELRRRGVDTRVVFMSGWVDVESFSADVRSAHEFLQKPFAPRDLLATIQRVLASGVSLSSEKKRVLVVDDEEQIHRLLGSLLESLDFDWVGVYDGTEALELMERTSFDLVISDMVMPRLDGIQTCSQIRQRHPETKIIAMSGKAAGPANLSAAMQLGAVSSLSKPFSKDELRLALSHAFGDAA